MLCTFVKKKRGCICNPDLHLNHTPIKFVEKKKFLGLIWDSKLKFKEHVNYLRKKCFKALNIIKILSHKDWGADTNVLLQLYKSLVQSKLDYGSIIYNTALLANETLADSLEVVHNQGLRLCLGAFKSSPKTSLNVEANTYPLRFRREKLSLQYAIKIKSNPDNAAFDNIFDLNYQEKYARKKLPDKFSMYITKRFEAASISLNNIKRTCLPIIPIWEQIPVSVNFEMLVYDKNITSPQVIQAAFNEVLEKYVGYFHLYTDGSKANDRVASAVVSSLADEGFRISNDACPFTAETEAIQRAISICDELLNVPKFVIFSDSKSCLQSIEAQESKNPLVIELIDCIQCILRKGKIVEFCWVPSHKGIRGNEVADLVAKQALSQAEPIHDSVPYTDKYAQVKQFVHNQWQQYWSTQVHNKLYEIMPDVGQYDISRLNRKEQVMIHRIRIGHTRLTHSYLMDPRTKKHKPKCIYCKREMMTVKHLMIHCTTFSNTRNQIYNVTDMKQLFDKVSPKKILSFIKTVGLIHVF